MVGRGSMFDQYRCADVYDALDSAKDSLAVSRADALLRSGPMPLASALKSIALVRMGRRADADKECDRALAGRIDAGMLRPLDFVMSRLGRMQQLAELYAAASAANPADKELDESALLACIRAGMFQRAQQTVLKRYRTSHSDRDFFQYLQLAVLHSMQLKPPGSTLALQVAMRLMKEHGIDETSLSEETLHLYLSLLLLAKADLSDALTMLEKPWPKRLLENSLTIQFITRECWELAGRADRIVDDCRARLVSGDRNWVVIRLYIHTIMRQRISAKDDAARVLLRLAEEDQWRDRGSFLGALELFYVARGSGLLTGELEAPGVAFAPLVKKYYAQFSGRASCFDDLRPYLLALSDAERAEFLAHAKDTHRGDDVVKQVVDEKVAYLFKGPSAASWRHDVEMYLSSLQRARVPETEMQWGDDLALMAVYQVLRVAQSPDLVESLLRAVAIAQFTCSESPRAYKLRILLIQALLFLGCPKEARAHYRELRLKNVQLDTVSHYMFMRNASFGGSCAAVVQDVWDREISEFYETSAHEVPDMLSRAFVNCKFSQAAEMLDFHRSVAWSVARMTLEIDLIRGRLANQDLVGAERLSARDTVTRLVPMLKDGHARDNRDPKLLPCIAEGDSDVLDRFAVGPKRGAAWIACMLEVLALDLQVNVPAWDYTDEEVGRVRFRPSPQLSDTEKLLLRLARALAKTGDSAEAAQSSSVAFFQQIHITFVNSAVALAALHAAWVGIEGLRLVQSTAERCGWTQGTDLQSLHGPLQDMVSALSDYPTSMPVTAAGAVASSLPEPVGKHTRSIAEKVSSEQSANTTELLRMYKSAAKQFS
ncbi:mitochondrial distribution and morphology [Malassezia sp. CBS 17886]|nr:mitochondrial distribution and morphology [Malassezia sp. CBS 17886]